MTEQHTVSVVKHFLLPIFNMKVDKLFIKTLYKLIIHCQE